MSLRAHARFCYVHRRWVVAAWLVVFVALQVIVSGAGTNFTTSFSAPNTESTRAQNLLLANFKAQSGDSVQVVMKGTPSMTDPKVKAQVESLLADLAKIDHVTSVSDPYTQPGGISKSGEVALANLQLDEQSNDIDTSVGKQMIAVGEQHSTDGLQVYLGGQLIQQAERQPLPSSELIGIVAAIIILLIAFGSVLAMALPIVVALSGLAVGLPMVELLTHVYPLQSFTTILATMIGIGVGIDYALFVVTRYRQALQSGLDPEEAVVTAIDTSGRAVLFAGLTVIIALVGMLAMRLSFISGLGIGSAAVVACTVLAAVTLLPAVLGFVGTNIDRLSLPWVHKESAPDHETMWHRWSRFVQRHPWWLTIAGLTVVLALALPVLSLRLGFVDAGNDPAGTQTRQAYDTLADGFGPGFNGPFLLAIQVPPGTDHTADLAKLEHAIEATPGVASATPAIVNPAGTTAVMRVYPTTAPQDVATSHLLHELRGHVIPQATADTGLKVYVGGFAAVTDDFANVLSQRLPFFIAVVIGLSFLLLMAVFRSILVPLKAAIMNLLSIGAAYGVVVMIFQYGWGKDLVGVGKGGPIEAFIPIMMFAILFGLSMDYEVFLLSRIREEYLKTGDNGQAVADGLSATARVITAAAAIMCTFFLSFVLGDNIIIKLFGIGFASAIFIDATLIRMVIVPSTMELLGDANWWLPGWLDRILPHLDVEGLSAPTHDDGPTARDHPDSPDGPDSPEGTGDQGAVVGADSLDVTGVGARRTMSDHPTNTLSEKAFARRWWTLAVLCLSLLIVFVGNSSLNVTIPTLSRVLGASTSQLQWVIAAYSLVFAGLLFSTGALGDRYGRKGALQFGLALYLVACLFASASDAMWQLIACRAVMGIAAAFIMPSTLSILVNVFPPDERTKAIAIWASVTGAAGAIGPVASGWLLGHYWYGSVFLVNVPILLTALVAGWFLVPKSRDPEQGQLDPVGALLSIVGIVSLVYGLIQAPQDGWTSPSTLVAFLVAAIVLALFVFWELRVDEPMLDIRYFRNPAFSIGTGGMVLVFLSMFGVMFLLTQYFQLILGYSPLSAALRLLPMAPIMIIVSPLTPRLSERFGANRVVAFGMCGVTAGMLMFRQIGPHTPYWYLLVSFVPLASGIALCMSPMTASIMSAVPQRRAGAGSAMNDATRELGAAFGIALMGSLAASRYTASLAKVTSHLPVAVQHKANISLADALAAAGKLGGPAGRALTIGAQHAFIDGIQLAVTGGAILAAISAVIVYRRLPREAAHSADDATDPTLLAEAEAEAAEAKAEPGLAGVEPAFAEQGDPA